MEKNCNSLCNIRMLFVVHNACIFSVLVPLFISRVDCLLKLFNNLYKPVVIRVPNWLPFHNTRRLTFYWAQSWWFLEIDSRKCNLSNEVWSGFQLLRSTEVARSSSCLFVVYSSAVFNTLRYSKVVCGILCELRLRKSKSLHEWWLNLWSGFWKRQRLHSRRVYVVHIFGD